MERRYSHSDKDIAEVKAYLAEQGIQPGPYGYDKATLAAAIQARGWRYHVEGMTDNWTAVITEKRATTQGTTTFASDKDRDTALLFALEVALREKAE